MIQLQKLSLSYGERTLFDDISLHISAGQRIGIVGANGAGKSTFLKALSGHLRIDAGSIAIKPGDTLAYMPQEMVLASEKPVFDEAFSIFDEELSPENYPPASYIHECKLKTGAILTGLGFTQETINQSVNTLSVGWKMRVVLAKLLLKEPDFYLFDEPTNHLDIVSKEWFLEFLQKTRSGFLLVSHDRYYLDKACDYIFELERGKGTLYTGNFTSYITQKEHRQGEVQAAYERQQRDIARKEATINRFRASANKAKMAQSMIKQLEKIELIEPEPVLPKVSFSFRKPERSGITVLTCKNISQTLADKTLFSGLSLSIERGEKVALIAPNGCGKTTLFNIIVGNLPNQTGEIVFGHNVEHAIFEQDQMVALREKSTVYEEVCDATPDVSESTIRKFLGSFLFSGDDVHKRINMLSGGERCRVALVKLLLKNANFLMLDEPTNHLDLYAKEVLLQALMQYEGTLLVVSHDHDFLSRLVTRVVELTPKALYSYPGTYESYKAHKKLLSENIITDNSQEQLKEKSASGSTSTQSLHKPTLDNKQQFSLRKELSALEQKIERLEKTIQEASALFTTLSYEDAQYQKTLKQVRELQEEHQNLLKRWEEVVKQLEI